MSAKRKISETFGVSHYGNNDYAYGIEESDYETELVY
jgi:hypothetical protein